MTDLARHWTQWRSLPGRDKRAVVGFALALPVVDIAVRMAGFQRTQRWLPGSRGVRSARTIADTDLAAGHRLAELAAIAGNHGLYPITCLRQALLVQWLLRRRGLASQLRIGALKTDTGTLDAHAWVELDGVALGQPNPIQPPFPMGDGV